MMAYLGGNGTGPGGHVVAHPRFKEAGTEDCVVYGFGNLKMGVAMDNVSS
jgi:hypothetical protein